MESPQISAAAVAGLLRAAGINALRREAARNKAWAKLLRGFRPQVVTLEQLAARAGDIAGSPALLRDVALVFLRSAGIPDSGPLSARLGMAAGRDDLPEDVRSVCALLAGAEAAPPTAVPEPAPEAEPVPEAVVAPAKPRRTRGPAKRPTPS